MKVRIEIDEALSEEEVLIRCSHLDETVLNLQSYIQEQTGGKQCITLYKGETEYFIPMKKIYFFETEGGQIHAHTADRIFESHFRLYELEETLPGFFMRISKSTIVNLDCIYSITRNLTASSEVEFMGSNQKAFASRSYYKALVQRLKLRRINR